jgi:hypothetical protein
MNNQKQARSDLSFDTYMTNSFAILWHIILDSFCARALINKINTKFFQALHFPLAMPWSIRYH